MVRRRVEHNAKDVGSARKRWSWVVVMEVAVVMAGEIKRKSNGHT